MTRPTAHTYRYITVNKVYHVMAKMNRILLRTMIFELHLKLNAWTSIWSRSILIDVTNDIKYKRRKHYEQKSYILNISVLYRHMSCYTREYSGWCSYKRALFSLDESKIIVETFFDLISFTFRTMSSSLICFLK